MPKFEITGITREFIEDRINGRVSMKPNSKFVIARNPNIGLFDYYSTAEKYRSTFKKGQVGVDFCETDENGFICKLRCELILEKDLKHYTVREY